MNLYVVRLLGIPVELHQRAVAAQDALMREFTLLAAERDPTDVPARLLALAEELSTRYADVGDPAQDAVLAAAAAEGEATADATYEVPAEAAEACDRLAGMLAETDEYCRLGEALLTLAPSAELVAYRQWFLGQFVEQIAGRSARSWTEVAPLSPPADDDVRPCGLGDEVVVPLSGAIDLETAPEVRATVAGLRERDVAAIVFDLSEVTFIDSVGLSLLVSIHHRLRDEGGRLIVRRPAASVRQVLEMTGLTDVLEIRS